MRKRGDLLLKLQLQRKKARERKMPKRKKKKKRRKKYLLKIKKIWIYSILQNLLRLYKKKYQDLSFLDQLNSQIYT